MSLYFVWGSAILAFGTILLLCKSLVNQGLRRRQIVLDDLRDRRAFIVRSISS
jgi:hypothetical protein